MTSAPQLTPPKAGEYSPFYAGYISRVSGDVLAAFRSQRESTLAMLRAVGEAQAGHRYAPGKWSVREVVGHMADTERTMAYRALRVARGETTPAPSFDENAYVPAGEFERRTLASVIDEFAVNRDSTIALFAGFPAAAWERVGVAADGSRISLRALAYIIAGHELHHVDGLQTRYGLKASGSKR
ncbi:MAG TPA: DinB family protein [Gemmatimonadaceae bacterium]|nr:DinB family protein [Gemmatimonadaceae bacterium]